MRHYGLDTYRLRHPRVIVEHYTGSDSYRSAYETFARDRPDVELHELPGLCAHFVIDRDGVIHQLVSLRLICRHTVGLNWTAIGIEHVGTSDAEIFANRRQLDASLRLTSWLQAKFGIRDRDVIGHSESLRSPYHHERVRSLRRQTHADFSHAAMKRYRRRLARARRATASLRRRETLGHSVLGRRIAAVEVGDPAAARKLLVFGVIHGDETAGASIARRLQRGPAPSGADLWIVRDLNPDGAAAGRRQNAHGVDLNRNFPRGWRGGRPGDPEYPGPRPFSEPETRIARRLVLHLRPRVTIWFHQPLALVDRSGGDVAVERRFADLTGLPLRRIAPLPGTATRWQNHRLSGTTGFVVELPPGRLRPASARRYAAAVLKLASARKEPSALSRT
jgi:N-acetylmuramoyl-L-alanine amidase/Zinc carboxypeptidase